MGTIFARPIAFAVLLLFGASGASGVSAVSGAGAGDTCDWYETARPVDPWPEAGGGYGSAVAIDGDHAVVAAGEKSWSDARRGEAYVLRRGVGTPEGWETVRRLLPPPFETESPHSARYGASVAIDGDTIAIGAPCRCGGAVYVYRRNAGGTDRWGLVATVEYPGAWEFGISVGLSGNTMVVGSGPSWDYDDPYSQALVFERIAGTNLWFPGKVLGQPGGSTPESFFGVRVAVDGDTIVVSASQAGASAIGLTGEAYMFERDAGGAGNWGHSATLLGSDAANGDFFGREISLDGDTVAVEASGDRVYVFDRDAGGSGEWGQTSLLTDLGHPVLDGERLFALASPSWEPTQARMLLRSTADPAVWDPVLQFPAAAGPLALDGDTIVLGDPERDESGGVSFFEYGCPVCGNGVAEIAEGCDDGAANSDSLPDACRTGCTAPSCRDGVPDSPEACDDGNAVDGDGCDSDCSFTGCGNGIATAGEACDDGNGVEDDACGADCVVNVCGDGEANNGEECDDGNRVSFDGCEQDCETTLKLTVSKTSSAALRLDWTGGNPSFQVGRSGSAEHVSDSGQSLGTAPNRQWYDHSAPEGLVFYRLAALCGDGVLRADEQCDDGNNRSGDGCRSDCTVEVCGNGRLDPRESCDDGNVHPGDGCSRTCTPE